MYICIVESMAHHHSMKNSKHLPKKNWPCSKTITRCLSWQLETDTAGPDVVNFPIRQRKEPVYSGTVQPLFYTRSPRYTVEPLFTPGPQGIQWNLSLHQVPKVSPIRGVPEMRIPLYRTFYQVPKVSPLEGFHCILYTVRERSE